MRIKIIAILLLGFLYHSAILAQAIELNIKLVDHTTNEPISNVHIFLANTTYGAVSNEEGICKLSIPVGLSEDLIISHVSYELKIVSFASYRNLKAAEIIYMTPNMLELSEMVVSAKRSRKWKKQFKKFQNAFLGTGEIAETCEILNPEVLQFEESEGIFFVTASGLIEIVNPHLGYEILYHLKRLQILEDGSIEYIGQSQFIDKIEDATQAQILHNRNEMYLKSPKYFFKTLIDDNLEAHGFNVELLRYESGGFIKIKDFVRSEVLKGPSSSSKYTVEFDEFLQVYNELSREVTFENTGVRPGGLESQRFSTGSRTQKVSYKYETSQLYKVSPYIILNEHGNVLNTKDVKEYGFWAEQKVAHQLPFDYGNNYSTYDSDSFEKSKASELENAFKDDEAFLLLRSLIFSSDQELKQKNLNRLVEDWEDGFAAPLIEILRLSQDNWLIENINQILKEEYDISDSKNFYEWIQWHWTKNFRVEDYYYKFKSQLYKHIDPKFENYFSGSSSDATIKLDEVLWGGVIQDGIPPLRKPLMLKANKASYLNDSDIVFGLYINGEARAYPKRILAWHEFFTDEFDGIEIAGVYCTLCGTVIAYDMTHENIFHDLGTSGFLYRSNKLMYDKSTQSLWSTIEGKPVIGPLVGEDIELNSHPVLTTSWGQWRKQHPETKVLSLITGFNRDYSEGAAYADYFSSDNLMFPVLSMDNRLKNKDEVLVIRVDEYKKDPLAISVEYLNEKKWHQDQIGGKSIIALTDKSGACRVYEAADVNFKNYNYNVLEDDAGDKWRIQEDFLKSDNNRKLKRVSAHNIFWFAWYNIYPNTRLVK